VFAVNYAAFGIVMIVFLVFEPGGLVGVGRRIVVRFRLRYPASAKSSILPT
jgi:branched-chain amino acid transport system permease protein